MRSIPIYTFGPIKDPFHGWILASKTDAYIPWTDGRVIISTCIYAQVGRPIVIKEQLTVLNSTHRHLRRSAGIRHGLGEDRGGPWKCQSLLC